MFKILASTPQDPRRLSDGSGVGSNEVTPISQLLAKYEQSDLGDRKVGVSLFSDLDDVANESPKKDVVQHSQELGVQLAVFRQMFLKQLQGGKQAITTEERLKALQGKYDNLVEDLTTRLREIDGLKQELAAANTVQEDFEELKNRLTELQSQDEARNGEIAKLNFRLEKKQEQADRLGAILEKTTAQNAALQDRLSQMTAGPNVVELQKKILFEDAAQNAQSLQEQLEKLSSENQKFAESNSQLEMEISLLKDHQKIHLSEIRNKDQELSDLQAREANQLRKLAEQMTENKKLIRNNRDISSKLGEAKGDNDRYSEMLKSLFGTKVDGSFNEALFGAVPTPYKETVQKAIASGPSINTINSVRRKSDEIREPLSVGLETILEVDPGLEESSTDSVDGRDNGNPDRSAPIVGVKKEAVDSTTESVDEIENVQKALPINDEVTDDLDVSDQGSTDKKVLGGVPVTEKLGNKRRGGMPGSVRK